MHGRNPHRRPPTRYHAHQVAFALAHAGDTHGVKPRSRGACGLNVGTAIDLTAWPWIVV